jgi:quinol monooxygenase YgiN
MNFIQTISFTTARMDEMQKLMDSFASEPQSRPGFLGAKVVKDRDRENAYMVIAEFESYELAMENSARPETGSFAKQMAEMSDGPPTFSNYDLVNEDRP